MVYTRKFSKSKRSKRSKNVEWYDQKHSAKSLAIKALNNVKYIKGLVNSELYKYDGASSTAVSNTGTTIGLTSIIQGDGDNQRTGNSLLVKKIFTRLVFTQHASATDTLYRVLFIQDNQQIADTSPTFTEILDTISCLAPLNSNTVGRFKVLKNYFFHTSTSSDTVKHVTCSIPMMHHVRFNGTGSGDIQKGGLYLMVLSDQATNTPTMFYNYRVSYHDN